MLPRCGPIAISMRPTLTSKGSEDVSNFRPMPRVEECGLAFDADSSNAAFQWRGPSIAKPCIRSHADTPFSRSGRRIAGSRQSVDGRAKQRETVARRSTHTSPSCVTRSFALPSTIRAKWYHLCRQQSAARRPWSPRARPGDPRPPRGARRKPKNLPGNSRRTLLACHP